jgi:hypothetical protein
VIVESDFGRIVADAADGLARHVAEIDDGIGGDFTGNDDHAGGEQGLARHAGVLVLG